MKECDRSRESAWDVIKKTSEKRAVKALEEQQNGEEK